MENKEGHVIPEEIKIVEGNIIPNAIRQSLSAKFLYNDIELEKRGTLSPESHISIEKVIQSLSFSHFAELIPIEDETKRAFYEIECIKGGWSVRELNRQIGSLYYERSGLSKNKKKLSERVKSKAEQIDVSLTVRDPYVFEFLGLKAKEVMGESHLEDVLLDKLQEFLYFEAREQEGEVEE